MRFFHDDERLDLLVVFLEDEGEVAVGDVVRVGLSVVTSEVGVVTPSASEAIWRLACTNLALSRQVWQVRGRDLGDLSVAVSKIHNRISLLLRSSGACRQALQHLEHLALPDRETAASVFAQLTHLPAPAKRSMAGLFVHQRRQILPNGETELIPSSGLGLWNATTAAARELGVASSRPLGIAAGKLLQEPFQTKLVDSYSERASRR